jgi:glucose/arabinose dehydrogenase/mono/diheme cytochrome c family protein
MMLRPIILVLLSVGNLLAQNGDKPGETQAVRIPAEKIPPAPVLTPAQAIKTFKVPAGFEVQLVASEPLIQAPVAAQFDADGRLFVLEMRGFMNTPDAAGEDQPNGQIAVLEDTNGDGTMDRRTTFLDGLLMPRTISLFRDGLLVAEPPQLWFCRDTNGDGKADEKVPLFNDYGDRKNPEHTANGLVLAMDNWYYNLYHTWRYRFQGGHWDREPIPNRVQWGMAQDDFGRLFFTSNSDLLRGDLFPSHYAGLRAPTARLSFLNHPVARDQSVWPGRINPGVNRGYQPQTLREDGRLSVFTAACGTTIYRGDQFPEDVRNDAFVCEPSGNLIRRQALHDTGGSVNGTNAYPQTEFLTSTDERFRPVNLLNGPDGGLYIVDFARGIIQHRIYLTSYLRKQAESRGLQAPLDLGRIYRVVHRPSTAKHTPKMSGLSAAELVALLSHPNGWSRDTAQRLLVERGDSSVVPALESLARGSADVRAKLHALWTLEGLGRVSASLVQASLKDPHPQVHRTALRLSEPVLRETADLKPSATRSQVVNALLNGSTEVRVQAALSLGTLKNHKEVQTVMTEMHETTGSEWVKQALALGLGLMDPQTNTVNVAQLSGLTADEKKRFAAGKEIYMMACAACHQPHGLGQEGLAPPLSGSEWVAGSPDRLVRVVLHGLRGPIKVKGQTYQLEMPTMGILEDEQISQVLTYIRHEWGHTFSPVDAAAVKKIRDQHGTREEAWTETELLRFK